MSGISKCKSKYNILGLAGGAVDPKDPYGLFNPNFSVKSYKGSGKSSGKLGLGDFGLATEKSCDLDTPQSPLELTYLGDCGASLPKIDVDLLAGRRLFDRKISQKQSWKDLGLKNGGF